MNMSFLPMFLSGVFKAEKISVPEALLLSLIGFAIVFTVLIILIIVIRVLTVMTREKAPAPNPVQAVEAHVEAVAVSASGKVPAPGSIGECSLHTVDDKTAALLMSIVADDLKAPLNELRFISIREI